MWFAPACMWWTWSETRSTVGRAHSEYFADVRPVSTMVGIAGLVGPDFLVEIEVDAVVGE